MSEADALAALMRTMPVLEPGTVWLTGAGPGDPELLTLQAVSGLRQADVIVHDALVAPEILALAGPDARLVYAGKRGGRPSAEQADISNTLVELAQAGHRVLRLKGGDPYVFGRGGEEALGLAAHGIPFLVVPGLTAGLAGLTAAGIPATMRGVNRAVVLATGHAGDGTPGEALDWAALARLGQPVVIYMAVRTIARHRRRHDRGRGRPGAAGGHHLRRDHGAAERGGDDALPASARRRARWTRCCRPSSSSAAWCPCATACRAEAKS